MTQGPQTAAPANATADVGVRVTRGFAYSVLRLLLGQVLGVVTIVVLTDRLTPSGYALYGAVATAGPAALVLLTGSLGISLVRQQHEVSPQQVHAANTIALTSLVSLGVVAATVGALLGEVFLGLAVAAYLLLLAPSLQAWVTLHRELRSASVAFMDLADRAGLQIATAGLALSGAFMATDIMSIAVIASGVSVCVVALMLIRRLPRLGHPRDLGVNRSDLASALLLTGSSVGLESTLIPLVTILSSSQQAGYFAWSMSLMVLPLGFAAMAFQVLMPGFSRAAADSLPHAVGQATRLTMMMGIVMTVSLLAVVPSLLTWLFPATWEPALPVLALLGVATVTYVATLPMVAAWSARGDLARLARTQAASTVVGLLAAAACTYSYGAIGGAAGLLAGRLVLYALAYRDSRRAGHHVPAPYRMAAGAILAPSLGVVLASGVDAWIGSGAPATLAAGVSGMFASFLLTRIVLGSIVVSDVRIAWRLLRRRTGADHSTSAD